MNFGQTYCPMPSSNRSDSANPFLTELNDQVYVPVVDPTEPIPRDRNKNVLISLFTGGEFTVRTPFSNPTRTTDTAISENEARIPYAPTAELAISEDSMPTATNGKCIWFYNDGTANLTIPNVRLFDGTIGVETVEPGGRIALVGDGTNWRYQ